ncbi:MAG: glycosyltransferase family 39 protein [Candidatus Margulisbacteria bacterium]|nr:glycosyltransferase family 39 protein [Candidatus Margulisiibacteriota bacterium]
MKASNENRVTGNGYNVFTLRITRYALLLATLASLLYFFKLGSFSLYDAAETTYGEFVKNILNSGDWLTLHYNGGIIFDKPPLFYWLAAALSKLIGFNEWAMRFWAAFCGVLTVLTTYALGKKFYNERTGFFSGIIVMTAFQFLVQSRIAELDIVLTLFMTLSLLLWYKWYSDGDQRSLLLSFVPLGLGLLIKGLLAVALPACAVFLFLLFKNELKKLLDIHFLLGFLVILVIGLPWYVAEYLIHGRVFLDFALGFLFLSRFQGAVSGHAGPWYYYFFALLLGFAPWSQFIPLGLWQTFKNRKNDPELLSLCFILPAFIVFSIAQTKIPNYILPLYPFLAIMVGRLWDEFLGSRKKHDRDFLIAYFLFAVVVILLMIAAVIAGSQYSGPYQKLLPQLYTLAAILVSGSLLSIIFFLFKRYQLSFILISLMVFILVGSLTLQALPAIEKYKGAKPLGLELAEKIQPGDQIAVYNVGNRPSIVLHSPKPVKFLENMKAVNFFLSKKGRYLFTTTDEYEKIKPALPRRVKILDKKGDLLVLY